MREKSFLLTPQTKRNIFTALSVLLFLVCVLSACGGKDPVKNEKELEKDLVEEESLFQTNTEILSFKIVKRQTNKEAMTDVVYVEVESKGQEFQCVTSYIMDYSLYDEGWFLENIERWYDGEWYGKPLTGVSENLILESIVYNEYHGLTADGIGFGNDGFSLEEIKMQDTDLENGTATVYYTYSYGDTYGRYLIEGHTDYCFDNRAFCYYVFNTAEDTVQYILSDNMVGQTFNVNKTNSITSIGHNIDITFTKSESGFGAVLDVEHMYIFDPVSRRRDFYRGGQIDVDDIEVWVDSYVDDDSPTVYYGRCALNFVINGREAAVYCDLSPVKGLTWLGVYSIGYKS